MLSSPYKFWKRFFICLHVILFLIHRKTSLFSLCHDECSSGDDAILGKTNSCWLFPKDYVNKIQSSLSFTCSYQFWWPWPTVYRSQGVLIQSSSDLVWWLYRWIQHVVCDFGLYWNSERDIIDVLPHSEQIVHETFPILYDQMIPLIELDDFIPVVVKVTVTLRWKDETKIFFRTI